ncbi:PREDICTED: olfactory receptor 1G1-like [Nanorana parkeri]|uniref:olfactory receptor 1G1-like n=1 Tax=Nanorana parkeri TaxID=125878 RepID=UPI0008547E92|nr:PREDICTED: olfactory receptor 1G1-like [Nanorana parkeri]
MDNLTHYKELYILAFSSYLEKRHLIFTAFLLLYLIGVVWNLAMIIVIYCDSHLHTPMYLFLINLSLVDICYPTVTLPKLMDILLTRKIAICLITCLTQTFFFMFMGGTEIILLSCMAYDRYVAICNPLHYSLILNNRKCALLLGLSWGSSFVNAIFITLMASQLVFCHTKEIYQFFCDVKALSAISCADVGFQQVIFIEALLYGLFPLVISLTSYANIIKIIAGIKTSQGRKKAFSTCLSHLSVVILYYVTIMCVYMRSADEISDAMDHFLSVLYTTVTPMLNPLIYSLRNQDVQRAILKLVALINVKFVQ